MKTIAIAAALVVASAFPAYAVDPVWSIPQFVARKVDWDRFLETPLRVEGRISTHSRNQLRFVKCDLTFRVSEEQSRTVNNSKNAEVAGRIVRDKDNNRLYFDVVSLKSMPIDADQFRDREAALKNPKPEEWYALGHWASERGRFYEDTALVDSGRTCLSRGLGLELRELSKEDVDGRFRLAEKVPELGLPDTLADELRHEAFRAWWTRATSGTAVRMEDLDALLKRVGENWPNSLTPLIAWPTEVLESYTQDPLGTYRQGDDSRRSILQRIFTAQVQLRKITASAAPDGKNGSEIANLIERQVPERKSLAEQYREQELRYRESNIATKSKAEAIELANEFRRRKRDDLATESLKRWLTGRSQKLSKTAGAPEHLSLADDYWSLLKDEATTVAHLEAARRLEPESEDVQARYRELGYEWIGGRWVKASASTATPNSPESPKVLALGLTSDDVRKIQGGPTRVSTITTGQAVDEFWSYGDVSGSRLIIQFSRRLHQSDFKVVRIYQR